MTENLDIISNIISKRNSLITDVNTANTSLNNVISERQTLVHQNLNDIVKVIDKFHSYVEGEVEKNYVEVSHGGDTPCPSKFRVPQKILNNSNLDCRKKLIEMVVIFYV